MLSKNDKYLIAGVVSFSLAIPFLFLASSFWMGDETAEDGLLGLGAITIFMLGAPLTIIPMILDLKLSSRGLLIVLNLLFIIQWIIWSQLIVFVFSRNSNKQEH